MAPRSRANHHNQHCNPIIGRLRSPLWDLPGLPTVGSSTTYAHTHGRQKLQYSMRPDSHICTPETNLAVRCSAPRLFGFPAALFWPSQSLTRSIRPVDSLFKRDGLTDEAFA